MHSKRSFIKKLSLYILIAITSITGVQAKSCLWKVTSETGTLYLQGSIHALKAEHYPLAPAIEKAYAESRSLFLEVDMGEMTDPATQQLVMKTALLQKGKTLQSELNEPIFQQLKNSFDEISLPITSFQPFKPWFAMTTLTVSKMQQMGFDPQYGLDKYFYDQAMADGKPIIGLENVAFQINLLDQLADTNPNDLVAHALSELKILEEDLEKMEKAWLSGDLDVLDALIIKEFKNYPDLHQTFLLDRNKRWFKKLETSLKQPTTQMMVVGAGHLAGKGGLLELFKQKGYTLEQL